MKDRIAHIIRAKNLTAAEFAVRLGIQPSNVSHLLSGRNNPSLDFVKKLKETFPEYNLDWLIMGTGPMTVSEPFLPSTPPPLYWILCHQRNLNPRWIALPTILVQNCVLQPLPRGHLPLPQALFCCLMTTPIRFCRHDKGFF